MGKQKKKRNKPTKHDPLLEESMTDSDKIIKEKKEKLKIVTELESIDELLREQACNTVSYLVEEKENIDELLSSGAIYLVTQLLMDPYEIVRTAAAGGNKKIKKSIKKFNDFGRS
jgi:hypothetical protein